MRRQLPSCGQCDVEENHSKSMWDVQSSTNLPPPPQVGQSLSGESQKNCKRTLPFSRLHENCFLFFPPGLFSTKQPHEARVASGGCNQGTVNSYCVFETVTVCDITTLRLIVIKRTRQTRRQTFKIHHLV